MRPRARVGLRVTAMLNLLAAVVLVLVLVLRRLFDVVIGDLPKPSGANGRRIRLLLGPAAVAVLAFLAVGLWTLVDGGYWVVALLVLVCLGLQAHGVWAWRRAKLRG